MLMARASSLSLSSADAMPAQPASALLMLFVASLPHRWPHRFVVVSVVPTSPRTSASSVNRGVISPLGSPTVNAVRSLALVRSACPGSYMPAPRVTTQPTTRVQPAISAMASSLMPFCADTM